MALGIPSARIIIGLHSRGSTNEIDCVSVRHGVFNLYTGPLNRAVHPPYLKKTFWPGKSIKINMTSMRICIEARQQDRFIFVSFHL